MPLNEAILRLLHLLVVVINFDELGVVTHPVDDLSFALHIGCLLQQVSESSHRIDGASNWS